MDAETKKKRGRKPKVEPEEEASTDVAVVESAPEEKKKRGRKPKSVYNAVELSNAGTSTTTVAPDDENIIVQLQINQTPSTMDTTFDPQEEQPFAYNRDNYANVPHVVDMNNSNEPLENAPEPRTPSLKVVDVLKDFEQKNKNKEWPANTSIACYWCCHRFETPPLGIPVSYNEGQFDVYGCFCSLECAAAFNFKSSDSVDEVWERYNLIHLLARRLDIPHVIKPAPDRMALKMFGGFLDIETFRKYTSTYKLINVNFPPMTSLTQQIEEVNEYELNPDLKYIPIDHERINRCKEKMIFRRNKPLISDKTTIESTMNLKYS